METVKSKERIDYEECEEKTGKRQTKIQIRKYKNMLRTERVLGVNMYLKEGSSFIFQVQWAKIILMIIIVIMKIIIYLYMKTVSVSMYVCMFVCMYVCMYKCLHVCSYVHQTLPNYKSDFQK